MTFTSLLAVVAVWHGSIWQKYGRIDQLHKKIANALKAFVWACNAVYYYHTYPFTWSHVFPAMVAMFVFQAFVWWALFDIAVNLAGGQKPFHMGATAATDRIFTHYWEKAVVQVAGIVASGFILLWSDSMAM